MSTLKYTLAFLIITLSNHLMAMVTFKSCPTLKPLPIVSFQPNAMKPIENVAEAFDAGFNVTLRTAIKTADLMRMQAINDSYNQIIKSYIQSTTNSANKDIELEQQMFDLQRSALSQLETAKDMADSSIFPSDPVYSGKVEGRDNVNGNTRQFLQGMCTMTKMVNKAFSEESRKAANNTKSRRNVGISEAIKQVQTVRAASQEIVDMHYDIFCSQEEFDAGVCLSSSVAPKLDINATNVLYPVGFIDSNAEFSREYRTKYTYNQLESFAANQFVRNVIGVIPLTPPSKYELTKPGSQIFVGNFKRSQASLGMAADAIQYISALREPVNRSGVVLSPLDILSYQLAKSRDADTSVAINSSSDEGRALSIAQQMAFQNQLQYLLYRIEDYERLLDATQLANDIAINSD